MIALGVDPGAVTGLAVARVPRIGAVEVIQLGSIRDEPERFFRALLERHRPNVVAIESVTGVYRKASNGNAVGPRMASHLVASAHLAGRLHATATMMGFPAVEVAAVAWRRAIVGGNGSVSDARIKAALTLRCGGVIARSNAHQRDALGCAIYGGLTWLRSGVRSGDVTDTICKSGPGVCQVNSVEMDP